MHPRSVERAKSPRSKRASGQSTLPGEDDADGVVAARRDEEPIVEPESRFFNRELSALDYNARILACAEEARRPALERARFLAICSRNLDEFFQIRVSGLREQVGAGVSGTSPDGMSPREQIDAIRARAQELVATQTQLFEHDVKPLLHAGGVRIADWEDLKESHRDELRRVFEERIFPVLTPLAVDPAHPFPYISDLSLNLAVVVRDPGSAMRRFARVKVPPLLPRFLKLSGGRRFVPIEQVIAAHLERLFPGMDDRRAARVPGDTRRRRGGRGRRGGRPARSRWSRCYVTGSARPRRSGSRSRARCRSRLRSMLLRELDLTASDLYAIDGLLTSAISGR